jgi:hypothetical protein
MMSFENIKGFAPLLAVGQGSVLTGNRAAPSELDNRGC